jgi:hypothetical protein
MKTKVNGIAAPPYVLASPGAERSEAERSEAERSAVPGEARTLPDPEVLPKAQRRQFTADYKRRILAEADSTTRRVSSTLRHPALEFTDFLLLSFGRLEPAC